MTVRLAVRAQGDLRKIIEVIRGNEPFAARQFKVAFAAAVDRIEAFPRSGVVVFPRRAIRSLLLQRWGYWIFMSRNHAETSRSSRFEARR